MNCKKLLPIIIISFILFSCNRNGKSALKDESFQELKTIQSPQEKKQEQAPIPVGQPQQADSAKTGNRKKTHGKRNKNGIRIMER